jgi:beta-1,2-xylosyltransferase
MYIPSKLDFTDLADILAFFRGTPKHPVIGKALARNGVSLNLTWV